MLLLIARDGDVSAQVELCDVSNLRELKVVIESEVRVPDAAEALGRLSTIRPDGQVWLPIDTLKRLGQDQIRPAEQAQWLHEFSEMIAYAARKGWVDESAQHVSIHCERDGDRVELGQPIDETEGAP